MFFYYPAQAINGALSSFSICMAYASDLLQVDNRAPAFGLILSSFSVGILVGPLGGGYIPPKICSFVALGGVAFCVIVAAFLIPESTTKETRMQARIRQQAEPKGKGSPLQGFSILTRSPLFMKLTVAVMLTGIVTEGMYELIMQYFQIKLGFQAKDQSNMFVLAGLCGMFTQLVLLRLLVRYVGKSRMLLIGLSASLIQQVCMTLVWNKPTALAAMCLGSLGNLSFPAISSIKSINVLESEQGAVQGALQGARALAQGLGPLAFAGIFSLFTKTSSPLPYFPGAPFVFGAVLMLIALIVAATVDRSKADTTVQHTAAAEADIHEPLLAAGGIGYDEENPEVPKVLPPNYILQHNEAAMLLDQVPEGADEALIKLAGERGLSIAGNSSSASTTGNSSSADLEAAEQEGMPGASPETARAEQLRPSDSVSSQRGRWMSDKQAPKGSKDPGEEDG
jgi:DHA1 family tetracycline resistance protein-like MFS transporter